MDYREMPREWDGVFDRVVSIEMVAHVGEENMVAYYGAIDRVMKRKDAIGVVQALRSLRAVSPSNSFGA